MFDNEFDHLWIIIPTVRAEIHFSHPSYMRHVLYSLCEIFEKAMLFFYCFIYIHILYYNFSFWFLIITVNAWTEEAFIFLFLFLQNSFYYYYYLILYSFLLQNIFNYCKIVNDLWEAFFFLLFFIIIIL